MQLNVHANSQLVRHWPWIGKKTIFKPLGLQNPLIDFVENRIQKLRLRGAPKFG